MQVPGEEEDEQQREGVTVVVKTKMEGKENGSVEGKGWRHSNPVVAEAA